MGFKKGVIITTSLTLLVTGLVILIILLFFSPQAFEVEEEQILNLDDLVWVERNIVENLKTIENSSDVVTYIKFINFLENYYPNIEKNLTLEDSSVIVELKGKNSNISKNLTVGE
ncbi:hypothetical protein DRN63_01690 [Nanoarchaeota archaeon]|nr:MAG: hypothetical protein DRN63_01690 [Nanoarchaeota archaeon]